MSQCQAEYLFTLPFAINYNMSNISHLVPSVGPVAAASGMPFIAILEANLVDGPRGGPVHFGIAYPRPID